LAGWLNLMVFKYTKHFIENTIVATSRNL
jgi:hypothetical protein